MQISDALNRSEAWITASVPLVNSASFSSTTRNRVGISLLDLSAEHHRGLTNLCRSEYFGTAMSILRPQLEAAARGMWYLLCATHEQVDAFVAGRSPAKLHNMIVAIAEHREQPAATLAKLKVENGELFHDYAHGGITQVKTRVTAKSLTSNHNPQHVAAALDASLGMATLAYCELVKHTDKPELAKTLQETFDEQFPKTA